MWIELFLSLTMFVSPVYVASHPFTPPSLRIRFSLIARAGQGILDPPITAPQAGELWTVGSIQFITPDIDGIPPSAAGDTGTLLGYFDTL